MAVTEIHHFIGGQAARSVFRKMFDVTDPSTGRTYARITVGVGADIDNAAQAARIACQDGTWPALTAGERAGILNRVAEEIDRRADEIAGKEALGTGVPVAQGQDQATLAAVCFRAAAASLGERDSGACTASGEREFVLPRPAGVAGVITSWRAPFLCQARAVAPALAAGCTIVLKPDELAPLSAALLAEITTGAGLPGGVLNVVHGSLHRRYPATKARDRLVEHPDVTVLAFSGDPAVGEQVTRDAATHGKPLSAELARHAPCVIFADADLDRAVAAAAFGAFALNGERHAATSRILAERPAYEAVVTGLAERADAIRVGDPFDPATEIGPLVHSDYYDLAMAQLRLGLREGARLVVGGRRPVGCAVGNYLAATVLAEVTPEMRIFAEQTPGPLICVTPFDTEEEAAALARATGAGHTAYLWTSDPQRARRLASAIDCALTQVNVASPQAPQPPSGEAPGQGQGSIDFYTRYRTVRIATGNEPVPRLGNNATGSDPVSLTHHARGRFRVSEPPPGVQS